MLIEWMDEREQAQNLDANAQPDEETCKTQELIRRVMEQVLADEGVQMETVVGVTLVDPDRIREINNAFRQVAEPRHRRAVLPDDRRDAQGRNARRIARLRRSRNRRAGAGGSGDLRRPRQGAGRRDTATASAGSWDTCPRTGCCTCADTTTRRTRSARRCGSAKRPR